MDTIISRLKKVAELADRGVAGEMAAAKLKLNTLLDKYGLTLDDIRDDDVFEAEFWYRYTWQRRLINQIVWKVMGHKDYDLYTYRGKRVIIVKMTTWQHMEASDLIEWHTKQFKKELKKATDKLRKAYVHKHKIFGEPSKDETESTMSFEEMMEIASMKDGMEDVSYQKKLNA